MRGDGGSNVTEHDEVDHHQAHTGYPYDRADQVDAAPAHDAETNLIQAFHLDRDEVFCIDVEGAGVGAGDGNDDVKEDAEGNTSMKEGIGHSNDATTDNSGDDGQRCFKSCHRRMTVFGLGFFIFMSLSASVSFFVVIEVSHSETVNGDIQILFVCLCFVMLDL